jgi:hypothetical protein
MRRGVRMHVLLLGSSPLLIQKGLTESLLGRFEVRTLLVGGDAMPLGEFLRRPAMEWTP